MKKFCSSQALRAQGHSLFEICIVLAVVGVLAAISVPRVSALLAPSPKRDAIKVAALFDRVLLAAQSKRESYLVALSPAGLTWHRQNDPETLVEAISVRSKLTAQGSRREISIYPTGVVSPITLTVTAGATSCTVALSLRGRATVRC